jgi:hypothetical protein
MRTLLLRYGTSGCRDTIYVPALKSLLLTTLLELRSFPRRRHIAPLDFVGTIGQLNGPKSQLTNNIWLHCNFLSFWTEKLLGLAGPNLLVVATSRHQ